MAFNDDRQSLRDKKLNYFGGNRHCAITSGLGSSASFSFISFSGASTGFGTANNVFCNRLLIQASGGNTANVEYMITSGAAAQNTTAVLQPNGNSKALDGISASGLWARTNTSTQIIYVEAW